MPRTILIVTALLAVCPLIYAQSNDVPKQALLAQDAAAQAGKVEVDLEFYHANGDGQQKLARLIAEGDVALAKLQASVAHRFGQELARAVLHAAGTEDAHDIESATEEVEGDHATIKFKDNSPPLHMVRVDGKWKISLPDMIGEATDLQLDKLNKAIAEFTAEIRHITDLVEGQKFRSGEGVRDRVQELHDRLFKNDAEGQRVQFCAMRRVVSMFVIIVWGLWFGGLVVLFISVQSLFNTFADRHDIAGQGAARIFHAFNAYQLGLATAALIATVVWRTFAPPKLTTALFVFLALATVGACSITMYFAPHIEMLQHQGLTASAQIKKMHGLSMIVYVGETFSLLIAGLLLPWMREQYPSP